jgi:branched-chain amino acid aminotransferase
MRKPVAFFNGQWIPASAAAVPVNDAGFVLGTTVTEQLRTFGGRLFHLDEHLARLAHSLEVIGVMPDSSLDQFAQTACELVARNHAILAPGDDLGLSIFVTPGDYPAYSATGPARPTVCMHTYPLPFRLWAQKYRDGQVLVITEVRQVPPQCWPAGLKCRSRMHYYLADRQAAAVDPQSRALLLDADGFVSETSTANVMIYSDCDGLASPSAAKTLRGISLSAAMELGRRLGIEATHCDLTIDDVASAQEAFLTSTPMCLLPVVQLNGRPIGDGKPGPVFRRIIAAWSEMVGVDIIRQAEQFSTRTQEESTQN